MKLGLSTLNIPSLKAGGECIVGGTLENCGTIIQQVGSCYCMAAVPGNDCKGWLIDGVDAIFCDPVQT